MSQPTFICTFDIRFKINSFSIEIIKRKIDMMKYIVIEFNIKII